MSIEIIDQEDQEGFDYDSQDTLNQCNKSVQHRLLPIQTDWQIENSGQWKFFIENNE
tara:strand:+ start:391 stop:561 length:171 start_codon:yes stop_codon:yes gene_type:complete